MYNIDFNFKQGLDYKFWNRKGKIKRIKDIFVRNFVFTLDLRTWTI